MIGPRVSPALYVAFALLSVSGVAHAQSTAEATKSGGAGSISGTVSVDGRKAAGVLVYATESTAPSGHATTDEQGAFTLSGLPAGNYLVSVRAPALVLTNATVDWRGTGQVVSVSAGEEVGAIDLAMTTGGVITGRVTSSDGQPVVMEYIAFLEMTDTGPRRQLELSPPVSTDDRGVYRAYGLPPGRYLVAAGRPAYQSQGGSQYPRTYFPSVQDISRAQPVEIGAGSLARNMDIVFADPAKRYTASGRVHAADGSPVKQAFAEIATHANGHLTGISGADVPIRADGTFAIADLAPGAYVLKLMPPEDAVAPGFANPLDFEISDHDVTGLDVVFEKGGGIDGVVILDGDDPVAKSELATRPIIARREPDSGSKGSFDNVIEMARSSKTSPGGAFAIDSLKPGTYSVAVESTSSSKGTFYVWGIDVAGAPVNGVDVKADDVIRDVRVHVRYGTSSIRGSVRVIGDVPPGLAISVALRRPDVPDAVLQWVRVSPRGQFVVNDVPAGDFDVAAYGSAPMGNRAQAAQFHGKATRISVPERTETSVELTLDVASQGNDR